MRRPLFYKRNMKTIWMCQHKKCLDCWDYQVLWIDSQNPNGLHREVGKFHVTLNKATKLIEKKKRLQHPSHIVFHQKPSSTLTNTAFYHLFWKFPISLCSFLSSNFWNTTWAYANLKTEQWKLSCISYWPVLPPAGIEDCWFFQTDSLPPRSFHSVRTGNSNKKNDLLQHNTDTKLQCSKWPTPA